MNNHLSQAGEYIAKAREALRVGDKAAARQLGEQAALLAPNMEDAWLVLTASDPDPQDALAYAQKALQINPQSARARRGVEWASGRLKQVEALKAANPDPPKILPNRADAATGLPQKHAYQMAVAVPQLKSNGRNWLVPALFTGAACILLGFFALFALTSPFFSSIVSRISAPAAPQENLWAPMEIAKPEDAPVDVSEVVAQAADTPTAIPTEIPSTSVPTEAPALVPGEIPTEMPAPEESTSAPTETPGTMSMEIVEDTATSEYTPPKEKESFPSVGNGARWIDVDLTNQRVYAYEGDVVVNSFIVSTGTWLTPTVTGKHKIYVKVRVQDMSGPGYHLRDVPYVMFFHGDYGLHGTYWHNNFGTPMSRGCVNLTIDDAAWLFNWASVGTVVNVHY
ncbi:MAG TPA: L,D-transpeptidase family protein [Anaerolineales bacterium]|nr:L,D-transpeptidase family protein [Anaerolineales bacterium]